MRKSVKYLQFYTEPNQNDHIRYPQWSSGVVVKLLECSLISYTFVKLTVIASIRYTVLKTAVNGS